MSATLNGRDTPADVYALMQREALEAATAGMTTAAAMAAFLSTARGRELYQRYVSARAESSDGWA